VREPSATKEELSHVSPGFSGIEGLEMADPDEGRGEAGEEGRRFRPFFPDHGEIGCGEESEGSGGGDAQCSDG
jgi:hypothetical protein